MPYGPQFQNWLNGNPAAQQAANTSVNNMSGRGTGSGSGNASQIWNVLLGGMNAKPPSAGFEHWADIGPKIDQGFHIAETRGAPQLNAGPQDQFRGMQIGQAGQLQNIASGHAQGAGELAAQRQVANAMAQQQAMARMARGGNALLAGRQAARNTAGIGLAGAGMAQQAALGDQTAAQGLLAQLTGQGRGQDLQLAGQNAQLQSQQNAMNDQLYMNMLQQLTGMDAETLRAKLGLYQAQSQQQGILGPLLSGVGQGIAAGAI